MTDDTKQRLIELAEGVYVEADVLNIVGQIQDYDSNLRVKFLRPGVGDVSDAPYAIFEVCPDGLERLVFTVWELDQRVMERLYQSDNQKHDILGRLDKANDKRKADAQRRFSEFMEEARDIAKHIIKSPKTEYSIPTGEDQNTVFHSHQPAKIVPVK